MGDGFYEIGAARYAASYFKRIKPLIKLKVSLQYPSLSFFRYGVNRNTGYRYGF